MSGDTPWTVWDVVRDHVDRTPGEVAVHTGHAAWSYAELAQRVGSLADTIEAYAGRGRVVALDVTAAPAGVVATLACARAGCAVLPLSADSPPAHRDLLLTDARPALVVTEERDGELVVRSTALSGDEPADHADHVDTAYVMYTSGSTGRPKGVAVPHAALVERLAGLAASPGLAAGESMLAMTALSFDIAMAELLLPLTVGGRVVAAPPGARSDPEVFARTVLEQSPDVVQATPSFWRLALAWGWDGARSSRLWCGGEALTPGLAARLLPRCKELWNVYGPTEATIWASAALVESARGISLGRPLPGTGLFLVDQDGHRVDVPGTPGEILLYGAGLASGYLNRPELTARVFGTAATPDGPRRCYRTGDRARYRDDGSLEFLGRGDGQVKVRGHRIELGEVETVLERCPGVSQAAAVVRDAHRPEAAQLAVFVVAAPSVTARDVRAWLATHLPASMRPAAVSMVAHLPRTTAGKVDRTLLAARAAATSGEDG